jgi:hypothetical protein
MFIALSNGSCGYQSDQMQAWLRTSGPIRLVEAAPGGEYLAIHCPR